jgi:Ca2+-binding RTX toxin-like protein
MRKVTMLLAAIAVMMLFAAAAYAATITGTQRSETLNESDVNDTIRGQDGNDFINARLYSRQVLPLGDKDQVQGNRGEDWIEANDGDPRDALNGGKGYDRCFGDVGDKFVDCEEINGQRV